MEAITAIIRKAADGAMLLLPLLLPLTAKAQSDLADRNSNLNNLTSHGWEFELKAGLNVGGATPLGIPREIRHISRYTPHLNGVLEGVATKWMGKDRQWGVSAGVRLEEKRMTTGADVKNYHTEIIEEGDKAAGYWTGYDETEYTSTDVTIPVTANYRISERWKVRAGCYAAFRLDGSFKGHVKDGYLRNVDPTGEKVTFENGASAQYDFSDDLRHVLWGVQIGGSWQAYRHFSVTADLSYTFSNIFHSDFHTVTYTLHPLYLSLGFGYSF